MNKPLRHPISILRRCSLNYLIRHKQKIDQYAEYTRVPKTKENYQNYSAIVDKIIDEKIKQIETT